LAFSEFLPTEDWKEASFERCLIYRVCFNTLRTLFCPDRDYHPNIDCAGKLFTSVLLRYVSYTNVPPKMSLFVDLYVLA
jgi:hypothetical protein